MSALSGWAAHLCTDHWSETSYQPEDSCACHEFVTFGPVTGADLQIECHVSNVAVCSSAAPAAYIHSVLVHVPRPPGPCETA